METKKGRRSAASPKNPSNNGAQKLNRFGQKFKIGVMGSASGPFSRKQMLLARRLGEAIADHDLIMITGACPGLPFEAAKACQKKGGMVIGISPAQSIEEHTQNYHSPLEHHDLIIYTGSGLMGREVINIRSCDMVLILGGKSGTLGEFAIAYDEGRLIGVLQHSGGISDHIDEIVHMVNKKTGSVLIYDADPYQLVHRLVGKTHEMQSNGNTVMARFDGQPLDTKGE